MQENKNGFIRSLSETEPHIHGAETEPYNVTVSRFLRAVTEAVGGGKETSKHTTLALFQFQPGGGFGKHYRIVSAETPVFDLVFYVISGRIRVTLGDVTKSVGADTLIYCPSNVIVSMNVIGNRIAKMILIYGTGEGERMGAPVFLKTQIDTHEQVRGSLTIQASPNLKVGKQD